MSLMETLMEVEKVVRGDGVVKARIRCLITKSIEAPAQPQGKPCLDYVRRYL